MADISEVTLTLKKEDGTIVSTTTYDIKDKIAREQLNAIPDGTYPDMTVGNVISDDSYTSDQTPYLYRVSGGGVEVGKIEADKIVGGTVAFNQLVQNGNFADTSGWSSTRGTLSVSNNIGSYTSTEIGGGSLQNRLEGRLPVIPKGHRVMLISSVKPAHTTTFRCHVRAGANGAMTPLKTAYNVTGGAWTEISGIGSFDNDISGSSSQKEIWLALEETSSNGYAVGDVDQFKNIQIFDLTQMFGSAVADMIYNMETANTGSGVAFFRSLFPNDYYEYNTGELMSVEGLQSHDMVGFNQWDEEWANGIWDSTGAFAPNEDKVSIACKNKIKVFPNTEYYFTLPSYIPRLIIRTYDSAENFKTTLFVNNSLTFTMPTDCYYITFCTYVADNVLVYTGGLCINLSSDRNGEYEPYAKHSYPLDSSLTLRGIPKLDANNNLYYDGDTYEADGTVTRKYGVVDLGTLNWVYDSVGFMRSNSLLDSIKRVSASSIMANIISTIPVSSAYRIYNGGNGIGVHSDGNLRVRIDNMGTDAASFKTAMSGVMLVYELATPTEETAQPYAEYQKVSKYGTEEYVSTSIVPVGHVTKYPTDIVSKVDGLPSDFSTLIAPTESAMKATKAYTANDLIIVNNQLYRATTSIASGATLTVGTNVVATTIASLIKGLL